MYTPCMIGGNVIVEIVVVIVIRSIYNFTSLKYDNCHTDSM